MCFDHDSRPPIPPIAGGALDARTIELDAADGNHFAAYLARAAEPSGAGIVIYPDVRGLHAYYQDLALRFAENGIDAIAIDYFGRTAGIGDRGPGFPFQEHVPRLSFDGLRADGNAAIDHIRAETGVGRLFTIGFCMGGRFSFLNATLGKGLAGVIGFYGWPIGAHRTHTPAPADLAGSFECPVLAVFGGADEGDPGVGGDGVRGRPGRRPHAARGDDLSQGAARLLRQEGRRVLGDVGEGLGPGARLHSRRGGGLTWAS